MGQSESNRLTPIRRQDGSTAAERYLKQLCDHTFLSLWSYPRIFRDQGQGKTGGEGKEVCDLLVVFQEHLIIFSDKDCAFPQTDNLELDWKRWFRRAIQEAAQQIWGAERWLKIHPDRLFLDPACTHPFPLTLPGPAEAKVHRVIVAHDAARRCREVFGGSGSLMINPDVIGPMHTASAAEGGLPFVIGQIDPAKGYIHVLDDTSLEIVLGTLDTISDFVSYLSKKERFILSGQLGMAAGEEELLAYYLQTTDDTGRHDFVLSEEFDFLFLEEGLWDEFIHSSQRQAQIEADEVSYIWDKLIETFNEHILAGTQYYTTRGTHPNHEAPDSIMRFLAREPRTRRRMLARTLLELIETTPQSFRATSLMLPSNIGDPYYIFLLLPYFEKIPIEEYREVRSYHLGEYCMVVKLLYPDAQDIVGIATETGSAEHRSEDALYLDAREWLPEQQAEAQAIQQELGLLTNIKQFAGVEREYPM